MQHDFAALRREYADRGLAESDLAADPFAQFDVWLDDAVRAGLTEPNAMVLATADAEGRPSARTVLLKDVDERGFVWFSNYGSRKGHDLAVTPYAAVVFSWVDLERQVIARGPVERVSREESAAYFAVRPVQAQLGAWASRQSEVLVSRAELAGAVAAARERFAAGGEVPLPPFWGGYRLSPETVELWQGRPSRLHDRLRYVRAAGGWRVERLYP